MLQFILLAGRMRKVCVSYTIRGFLILNRFALAYNEDYLNSLY